MQSEHSAKAALVALNKKYPKMGQLVDQMAFFKDDAIRGQWPVEVLLPKHVWPAIYTQLDNLSVAEYKASAISRNRVDQLRFLGTWAKTQGIYRFDDAIYQELVDAPITGDIPVSVLRQLPEWCIYLETPGLSVMQGIACSGCWVMVDYDLDGVESKSELSIMFDVVTRAARTIPFTTTVTIPLGIGSIADVMEKYRQESLRALNAGELPAVLRPNETEINSIVDDLAVITGKILSLVLYVCTQNDYGGNPSVVPKRPGPVKTKRGLRLFGPATPKSWDVGVRMGAAMRKAYEDAGSGQGAPGGSVRPHIRRHHWHGFRVGKMKDVQGQVIPSERRELSVRFMPSIPVNFPDGMSHTDLPAVVRPVK